MQHAYICLLTVVLALASTTVAKSRLQFSLPREFLGDPSSDEDDLTTGILGRNTFESDESAERLQTALRAFLELDEGELRSLLKGISVEKVKDDLSPSTAFFLEASRSKLEILKDLLKKKRGPNLQGDFRIARRNKKLLAPFRPNMVEGDFEGRNFEASGDTDSLLGALTELSSAIGMDKRRQKKAQKKHKRHSFHSSSKTRNIHYSYWLKPEECPKSRDGYSRVHCPSPSADGDWLCVEDTDLCDGYSHCPDNEDEEPMACLFFKSMQNYVELLVSALLSSLRS